MGDKKPSHFKIFKILGLICVVVGIAGIILSVKGFGDFKTNNFMLGGILTSLGFFLAFPLLILGFRPELSRMATKSTKYIQQENKEDLTDIASTSADIASEAITKTVSAVKKGLATTMFCKHCGAKIDENSKFCKYCGKEQ